jgi:WD40 repeat protein
MSGKTRVWNVTARDLLDTFDSGGDMVSEIAFAPGGDRLAVAELRGTHLLDAASVIELARFAGHEHWVWAVAFLDRNTVVTAGFDATARLWDASPQHLVGAQDVGSVAGVVSWNYPPIAIDPIAQDPSGTQVLAGGKSGAAILDLATGQVLEWVSRAPDVTAVAWSPDGGQLAFGDIAGQVAIRTGGTTRNLVVAPEGVDASGRVVAQLGFSPDGHSLAASLSSGALRVIHLEDLRAETVSERSELLGNRISWGHDGLLAAAQPDGSVSLRRGSRMTPALPEKSGVSALAFAGTDLMAAHYTGLIEQIDTRGERSVLQFVGHTQPVLRLVRTPEWTLSVGEDATARIWNLAGAALATLQARQGSLFMDAAALGSELVATEDSDGQFEIWNVEGERLVSFRASAGGVYHRIMTGRHRFASIGDDGIVRIWRAEIEEGSMAMVTAQLQCLTSYTLNEHDAAILGKTACE